MSDPTRAQPPAASVGDIDTRPDATAGPPPATLPATRFVLGDEIARGAMGAVHAARDTHLGRDVAVKVLQPHLAGTAAERRFLDEARITGQLQHPGIPPVYDLGTLPDGRPFLALKLIKGDTLDALLQRDGPGGLWLGVFEGIAQAVGYAHAHGVIHRDLKPANVMVGAFGEVQVMDWGLAKLLTVSREAEPSADPDATTDAATAIQSERGVSEATRAGSVLGTPAYMAPEQAIGAVDELDRRTDVFGLGAVLCALLTGKPPFVGGDAESTRKLAARGDLADAFGRLAGCGAEPELAALCRRCLSVDKAARPADAGAVATAVAGLRQAADDRARRAEVERGRTEVRRKLSLRLGGLTIAVLLAGVAATGWQWRRAETALSRASEHEAAVRESLEREMSEGQRVTVALDLERQTRARLREALLGQAKSLVIRAENQKFSSPKENFTPDETDRLRSVWVAISNEDGPTADQQNAEFYFLLGKVYMAGFNYRAAHEVLQRAIQLWRLASVTLRADLVWQRQYSDGLEASAFAAEGVWKSVSDRLRLEPKLSAERVDTALAAVAGGAIKAAREDKPLNVGPKIGLMSFALDFFQRLYYDYPGTATAAVVGAAAVVGLDSKLQKDALLTECLEIRRSIATNTNHRNDRLRVANTLKCFGKRSIIFFDHEEVLESNLSWAEAEVIERIALSVSGTSDDWCELVESRIWLARLKESVLNDVHAATIQIDMARDDLAQHDRRHEPIAADWTRWRLSKETVRISLVVGDHRRAAAAAMNYAQNSSNESMWQRGIWLARCTELGRADQRLTADARQQVASEYATRAVELIGKAVAAGYRDRAYMLKDTDLDPLRGRADFRALLASLPEPAPPPRPAKGTP